MTTDKKLKICVVGMSPGIVRRTRLKGIPLAPMVLKAYVEGRMGKEFSNLAEIVVKTFFLEEMTPAEIASQILADRPDAVAFSIYIWSYLETMECARIIKDTDERINIICGGPYVSPVAKEIMVEHPYIDVIPYITIPGEVIFYHFIKALLEKKELDSVEGIIYRTSSGSLVKTAPLSENLDYSTAPSPYINNSLSLTSGQDYVLVLETSRGCPCDCGYCFYGRHINKVRYFPLKKLLREIGLVYSNPDVKHVFYADSDILLDQKRAEAIVKHMLKQNTKAMTEFDINIKNINKNLAKLLARLPHFRFCFGVQSVNPSALEQIGRLRPRADVFVEKFKKFKRWVPNIDSHIDVMLGLPGDDLAGFKATLDVCLSLEPTRIGLNYPIYLLPGTRFFEQRDELGLRYGRTPPLCIIETNTFPKQDIEVALRLALWMDVLTFRYPAIARFFYAACATGTAGTWIGTLEKWITAIEKNLDIFSSCQNMVDIAAGNSIQQWNKLKGDILRKASETESAYLIYHTIQEQEKATHTDAMEGTIALGMRIFDYMRAQAMDSVEFAHFNQLPDNITKAYHADEIRDVFSIYRR